MGDEINTVESYLDGFMASLEMELDAAQTKILDLETELEERREETRRLQGEVEVEKMKSEWKDREIEMLKIQKENLEMKIELEKQKKATTQPDTVTPETTVTPTVTPTVTRPRITWPTTTETTVFHPTIVRISWREAIENANCFEERLKLHDRTMLELGVSLCFFNKDVRSRVLPQPVKEMPATVRAFYIKINGHNRTPYKEWCSLYTMLIKEQKRQERIGMVTVTGGKNKRIFK